MGSSDAFAALQRCLDPPLWVVTAAHGGEAGGLLATHVSPASIVPEMPRVVVGIARQHRTWALIDAGGSFALHLLRDEPGHHALAARFGLESGRTTDKLSGLSWRPGASGSPLLGTAVGWIDCRVEARFDTGDRTLFLADVVGALAPNGSPVLTVGPWVRSLTDAQRALLHDGLARDATVDAAAIRAWRAGRVDGRIDAG